MWWEARRWLSQGHVILLLTPLSVSLEISLCLGPTLMPLMLCVSHLWQDTWTAYLFLWLLMEGLPTAIMEHLSIVRYVSLLFRIVTGEWRFLYSFTHMGAHLKIGEALYHFQELTKSEYPLHIFVSPSMCFMCLFKPF